MTITLELPNNLALQLQKRAEVQHRPIEDIAISILSEAFNEPPKPSPSLEEVVASIKATRGNPQSIRPAQGSLARALRETPPNLEFDLSEWTQQWTLIEAELRATNQADDFAEGRR